MNDAREQLAAAAKSVSSRGPVWVQGAGGNISVKVGSGQQSKLWIKASGMRLDRMTKEKGVACIFLELFREKLSVLLKEVTDGSSQKTDHELETDYSNLLKTSALETERFGRPSMETGFHAALPKKWVLHFHALSSLLMAWEFAKDSERLLQWLSKRKFRFEFIASDRPGLRLTNTVASRPDADIYILENHGIILHSDSLEILDDWLSLESLFMSEWYGYDMKKAHVGYLQLVDELRNEAGELRGPLRVYFPDTAVFLPELSQFLTKVADATFNLMIEKARSLWPWRSEIEKELNLAESWLATLELHKIAPGLPDLSAKISSEVGSLPTEAFRKGTSK
jgi:ribulose-5-phosphate 4-epimerase/fuculose-1-phosphate aldolase